MSVVNLKLLYWVGLHRAIIISSGVVYCAHSEYDTYNFEGASFATDCFAG